MITRLKQITYTLCNNNTNKTCVVLSFVVFFVFFFSITQGKGLFIIFSHKHLGLSLFLPLLFGSFSKKGNFPPFPQKKQPHFGTFFRLLLFSWGLSLVVLILVIMVPFFGFFFLLVFVLFFWFAFSSFFRFLVWVSTFLLTPVGICFFFFCGFFWFCFLFLRFCSCFSSSSLLHFFFPSSFFVFWGLLICVVHLWCCCFENAISSFGFFLFLIWVLLFQLLLYLWSCCYVFLLLLLPLAFSLVFSFLAFGHFFRFFSSSNLSFSLYNLTWSEFWLPFLLFENATFAIFARLVSGPFLGMGPVFLRKHYKNRGFRVFWHP